MSSGNNNENEKLQNLVKSCLLEINQLKMDLVELEKEKEALKDDKKIEILEGLLKDKDEEINKLKSNLENLQSNINKKELLIEEKDRKIEELSNFKKSFNDIKNGLEQDFNKFKEQELNKHNEELNSTLSSLSKKDAEIEILKSSRVDDSVIKSLENELKNKDERIQELEKIQTSFEEIKESLEKDMEKYKNKELEETNNKLQSAIDKIIEKDNEIKELVNEINQKNAEIQLANNQNIPDEKYNKLKEELELKDSRIKRLEEIKSLFSDLDDGFNNKYQSKEGLPEEIASIINDTNIPKLKDNKLINEDNEVKKLKKELQQCRSQVKELKKIENYYNQLTSPPKRDLTSFQSQIYYLIPDKEMNSQEIYEYIRKIAFDNISQENLTNILRNLERKGYLKNKGENLEKAIWIKNHKN